MTRSLTTGCEVVVHLLKHERADVEYPGIVRHDDGDHVVVSATWTNDVDCGCVHFLPGDLSTEHYWRTRWFGIWETRAPTGDLKGWYCNLSRPLVVDGNTLVSVDLELDLWIAASPRRVFRLDEDEFAASGLLARDPVAARAAWTAMVELEAMSPAEFAALIHTDERSTR